MTDRGSACGGRLVCLENPVAYEPDMVYSYLSTAIEVDALCECIGEDRKDGAFGEQLCSILRCTGNPERYKLGLIAVEEVSADEEVLTKPPRRALLTLAPIPNWLWIDKGKLHQIAATRSINSLVYLLASELINILSYALLTMPPSRAQMIKEHFRKTMNLLGVGKDVNTATGRWLADIIPLLDPDEKTLEALRDALRDWLKSKLEELRGICGIRTWLVLIQLGVLRYRLRSIVESIDIIRSICGILYGGKSNDNKRSIVYYFSQQVLNDISGEGVKEEAYSMIKERGGQVCENINRNTRIIDRVKECVARDEDIAVFIFGDYSKKDIIEIYNSKMVKYFVIIPESSYMYIGRQKNIEHGLVGYFGYLFGFQKWVRSIAGEKKSTVREVLVRLAKETGVEDGSDVTQKLLTIYFLLKNAIVGSGDSR